MFTNRSTEFLDQNQERTVLLSRIEAGVLADFEGCALSLFQYQARHNHLYAQFLDLLNRNPKDIQRMVDIPCLPISFFKSHKVQTGAWTPQYYFESSGTTGQIPSRHAVQDFDWYHKISLSCFSKFYGHPNDWVFLALLPNYIERGQSSLVAMMDNFIRLSAHTESSFYLYDYEKLAQVLTRCKDSGKKTMMIGVTYALLDFAERFPLDLSGVVLVETGGMKGHRAEWPREQVHEFLKKAHNLESIHSEYGMTELFSQAWSSGFGRFGAGPTLRVQTKEINDPFAPAQVGKTGVIEVIDLGNIDSCAFIATEDLGRVFSDGSFEVVGRLDASEMRGCNLMVVR